MTEKEIFNGVIRAKNIENNVLFFVREIDDIEEHYKDNIKLSLKFIDIDKNKNIDETAKKFLNDLKYDKIPKKLPQSNIFKYNV